MYFCSINLVSTHPFQQPCSQYSTTTNLNVCPPTAVQHRWTQLLVMRELSPSRCKFSWSRLITKYATRNCAETKPLVHSTSNLLLLTDSQVSRIYIHMFTHHCILHTTTWVQYSHTCVGSRHMNIELDIQVNSSQKQSSTTFPPSAPLSDALARDKQTNDC